MAVQTKAKGRPKKQLIPAKTPAVLDISSNPSPTSRSVKPSLTINPIVLFYNWINERRLYIPLTFAVSLQSFTIGLWVFLEFTQLFPGNVYLTYIILVISIMAGMSLESVMIGTVFSTTKETELTSYITIFAAWLGSTWIGLALFNTGAMFNGFTIQWDLKHAIWPTIISLYLLHMSHVKKNQ
jgi:hypothetical protein